MILQFGKLPPPIGGITIHIERLMNELNNSNINCQILDYSKKNDIYSIIKKIINCKIVHIHISRKFHRLLFIIIFRLLMKKVIVTFHGEYNFKNKYDFFSLQFASQSILLNNISFLNAKNFRKRNIHLIGAFIRPLVKFETSLSIDTLKIIDNIRNSYKHIFCTNAWNIVFDKNGEEIYGGSILISLFANVNDNALIFSDPQGKYHNFLISKFGLIPDNVLFIKYNHDFIDVINICDAFIRSTTTDGDSLSVHESLSLGKNVIASNVVDRPKGCILYNTQSELIEIISNYEKYNSAVHEYKELNNSVKLIDLYNSI